ncbi:MAG: YidC/Oxa1 family membrane protein insertase [Eubacteriales bacterium]|nr:YidC/Oxa1 family membrane protein insertase [Eubacteriales bacterium]
MALLARPLAWILIAIYHVVKSYGIALLILTAIVKFALYPAYKKQILSTADMGDIQPKIQEIQRKYADDRDMMNQKMAELYQEENFNPASGCLPIVIQMIILMGLFALLRNPLAFMNDESMVFAVHENFLWMHDLAQPDPWILPVLSGVMTFMSTYLNQKSGAMPTQGNSAAMTKGMLFIFPIMIVWLAKSYPAGLALYWFFSQFIQVFFDFRFRVIRKRLAEEKEQSGKKKKRVKAAR